MKHTTRIRRFLILAALCAFTLCAWSPALAASRRIVTPALGAPALVPVAASFDISLHSKPQTRITGATIIYARDASVTFRVYSQVTDFQGRKTISATLPADAPAGLYDLCVDFQDENSLSTDCRPHAVAVTGPEKPGFRFAVFSDFHVGDARGDKNNPGISLEELRAKGIAALNTAKPDFVLITGDVNVYPTTYQQDYKTSAGELAAGLNMPAFIVPGNHDLLAMIPMRIDGVPFWREWIGPAHMAFNWGPFRFIGFNSFTWPEKYRDRSDPDLIKQVGSGSQGIISAPEFAWIQEQVQAAQAESRQIILFAHHDPENMSAYPGDESFKVVPRDAFADFVTQAGVKYYFFGHTHKNYIRMQGGVMYVSTGTVSSGFTPGEAWSFRIIDVSPAADLTQRVFNFWFPIQPAAR